MTEVFGSFIEFAAHEDGSLSLVFSSSTSPVERRWRSSRLSAEFLSAFVEAFFSDNGATPDDASAASLAALKDSVNFAANELLENALKYAYRPSLEGHCITVQPHAGGALLYLRNRADPVGIEALRLLIGRLLSEEPADIYEQQVVHNAEGSAPQQSGLGLVTILNAHKAAMAWKFEHDNHPGHGVLITTMVSLEL